MEQLWVISLFLTRLPFQGLKLNDWNLWVQLQVQAITLRVVIWKILFFLEYKKHICLFSVERQAGWLYQSRLWFCFSLTSLLLHSTRCWAMGRTWSHLPAWCWCLVGKKTQPKTKWHGQLYVCMLLSKSVQSEEKSHPWAFCKSRLLLDGSQSTLEQHDLTLINAESYQGLKAASQAAHIPCVCTGHWL